MIATKLAALMAAMIIVVVGISAATPLVAEAQTTTLDQSNVEQNIEQVQNQEACTNIASGFIPGGTIVASGVQSNDCEVDQTQTANAVSSHETTKNIIRNLPA